MTKIEKRRQQKKKARSEKIYKEKLRKQKLEQEKKKILKQAFLAFKWNGPKQTPVVNEEKKED